VQSGIRYLTASDLKRLTPAAAEASGVIDRFYRIQAEGRVTLQPKLTLDIAPGRFFQSLCCAVSDPSYAICKWIGVVYANNKIGLPPISGSAILSDSATGAPLAILGGAALTAIRTAATSLSAAQRLARPDSQSIGFIGTGVQAQSHLDLFAQSFPQLKEVRILSQHAGSEGLAQHASGLGLRPRLCAEPREVVEASDIIVTSVPGSVTTPFLEVGWLPEGAFVSAVDLGRSWKLDGISGFDVLATDDRANSLEQQAQGIMPALGDFSADLADLVSARHPGRQDDRQRIAFMFPGFSLSDLAIAVLLYEHAKERDIGTDMAF
jgi:alanine dehydrogenase